MIPLRGAFPVLLVVLSLISSHAPEGVAPGRDPSNEHYVWTQLTPAAEFAKSYNFHLFADSAGLRLFHHDGVWRSRDGVRWQKTGLTNIVGGQAFLSYVRFRDTIFALGTFEGNIERHSMTSQIARTRDFGHWDIMARSSELPKRFFYHPFVFRDKIWIVGGEDEQRKFADAWTSTDAVHWTKVADDLPFGPRAGQQFIAFRDTLYMLDHDVWISVDGIQWKVRSAHIADGEIYGYAVEVYEGRIWLIGCSRSGTFRSEMLSSPDGVVWTSARAPWSPRGGAATCQYRGRIIMTGGKYGGPSIQGQTEFIYSNDDWAFGREAP